MVEGFIKAIDILDEIIATIRAQNLKKILAKNLMRNLDLLKFKLKL